MDFSQFLVQNPDLPLQKTNNTTKEQTKIEKQKDTIAKNAIAKNTIDKDIKKEPVKKLNNNPFDTTTQTILQHEPPYQQQQFKRGHYVIIQQLENSYLNIYKGYFGEIKDYRIIDESAYVILEAMNYPIPIKFPTEHLVHRTKFF
jgi:hypothetical protein